MAKITPSAITGFARTRSSWDFSNSWPLKGRVRMATVAAALTRIYHAAAYNEIAHAARLDRLPDNVCALHRAQLLMNPHGRVLALDLGKKRIGLAISDGLGITAQGLETLARLNKRTDLAILAKLIRERGVTQILMGNPLHMSGRESRQSEW